MKKLLRYIFILGLIGIIIILSINLFVLSFSKTGYYKNVENLEKNYVGLVFGAAIKPDGIPSDILKDRLKITYRAYKLGKVKKIIVSGDNSRKNYNEPVAMQIYLLDLGVNEDDIYLDYAGFDTYDSLYRVKEIFQINSITLFTQDFHLKRAMYISKRLGINTLGVKTNILRYIREDYYNLREIPARIKAFLEVEIFKTKPKFLGEKIEILTDEKIERIKNTIKK